MRGFNRTASMVWCTSLILESTLSG